MAKRRATRTFMRYPGHVGPAYPLVSVALFAFRPVNYFAIGLTPAVLRFGVSTHG
jgi:hypothetical protein